MTKIQSSKTYRDFMKGFLTRDDVGRATPADCFDVVVKSQGRWKSYRFVYESETKWCNTPGQVDEIIESTKAREYAKARNVLPEAEKGLQ